MQRERRWASLFAAVVCSCQTATAQQIGVRIGRDQSTVRWDRGSSGAAQANSSTTNTIGGLTFSQPLLPGLAVDVELLGVTKGFAGVTEPDLLMHYVDLPILARVALPRSWAAVSPYAVAGVTMSCLDDARLCRPAVINADHIGPNDVGGTFGGGFELRLGGQTLTTEYRVTHGWRDIAYPSHGHPGHEMRNYMVSMISLDYTVGRRSNW